ncbi:MAG TPA: hypothetical protein VNV38_10665 [Stellaceae bacterium]|nr:hypothetical protein [Stellaceae bacterium]
MIKGRMKTPWLAFLCLAVFAARAHAQAPQTYSNVFDYCTAIGAIDQFDARFTGVLPESKAANLFKIEPGALHEGAFAWRCMNRAVWVCAQLNSPICGKTDISRAPTPAMSEYCKLDPDGPIPAVVMGHDHPAAYDWVCHKGVPTIARQLFAPDPRGYPPDLWKQLNQ